MLQGQGERPGQDVPAPQGHEREQHVRLEASQGVCWQCMLCEPLPLLPGSPVVWLQQQVGGVQSEPQVLHQVDAACGVGLHLEHVGVLQAAGNRRQVQDQS